MNRLTFKIVALILSLVLFSGIAVGCAPQDPVSTDSSGSDSSQIVSSDAGKTPEQDLDASDGSEKTNPEKGDSTDSSKKSTSENFESTDKDAEPTKTYKKRYNTEVTVDGNYPGGFLMLVMAQDRMNPTYCVEDFPEVNCVDVKAYGGRDGVTDALLLTLGDSSKEYTYNALKILEKRDDIRFIRTYYQKQYIGVDYPLLYEEFRGGKLKLGIILDKQKETPYEISDFPEVKCVSVQEHLRYGDLPCYVTLILEDTSKEATLQAAKILEQREDVWTIDLDYPLTLDTISFGDVEETPLDRTLSAWWAERISLESAWEINEGSATVKVGVIDTGISVSNAVSGQVNTSLSKCFTTAYSSGVGDADGHGTKVSSVIGATPNSSAGLYGVCKNVQLVSLRVATGTFFNGKEELSGDAICDAVWYAESHGIGIINCSFSGPGFHADMYDAMNNYSGIIVCSAGNDHTDIDDYIRYPANFALSNLITVGASNNSNSCWTYINGNDELKGSNYGSDEVDLFAPGASIPVAGPTGAVSSMSGTSFSVPMVTGVAALILSEAPNASNETVINAILQNVTIVNGLVNQCITSGILDARAALEEVHTCNYNLQDFDAHKSFCRCGEFTPLHVYTWSYTPVNGINHRAYCDCGASTLRPHRYSGSGASRQCIDCGYVFQINKENPEFDLQ